MLLVDKTIDSMVTPEGLIALLSDAHTTNGISLDLRRIFGMLKVNGLTEVDLISPEDPRTYLAFRTTNLVTWKLADFVVPDEPQSRRKKLTEASTPVFRQP